MRLIVGRAGTSAHHVQNGQHSRDGESNAQESAGRNAANHEVTHMSGADVQTVLEYG